MLKLPLENLTKSASFVLYAKKSLVFLWRWGKAYLFLMLLSILLDTAMVFPVMYLTAYSIDLLTQKVEIREYIGIIAVILGIMLCLALFSMLVERQLGYAKKRFHTGIRNRINDICLSADYSEIQSKAFEDSKKLALGAMERDSLDLFVRCLRRVLSALMIVGGSVYIIAKASLWILIPLAVSLAISLYNDYVNARHNFTDTREEIEYRRKSSYLQEISADFAFAKEIRLFRLKERFRRRMDEVEQLLFAARESRRKVRSATAFATYGAGVILDVAMYLFYGYQVLVLGSITLGEFSLYINVLHQLKNSLGDIIREMTEFWVNTEYLEGFFFFVEHPVTGREKGEPLTTGSAEILFENVSFRYPGADCDTLKNINIKINAGETVMIVGENGAGKTTFAALLCGLYRPTAGRILFNSRDISEISPVDYMGQISAVFQDYRLFAASIAENICAMSAPDREKLIAVLSEVGMLAKTEGTAKGVDTELYRIFNGDGVEFSGGEMQRLAIARAMYKQSPMLVLDEPTSALDPAAEYEIYSAFQKISQSRTTVCISHRLSSVKFSDRIAVFHRGEIAELGTHEELMAKDGIYAEAYRAQAGLYSDKEVRA